jgi:hypothetical protein
VGGLELVQVHSKGPQARGIHTPPAIVPPPSPADGLFTARRVSR